ncbi:protein FAM171B-like [Rhinatrema bivittatum]|uniref:protein FAM171B-like n=1 Tax=Rhinatrema bivittatum TaxID=194408 RepID=UPI00112D0643|nr:protein FAM171B-like [Rhinatrema bivittatum]XP_029450973.1 protein FAM171B-like [Rhinatrema bivittatum]XP_029450974.1 protein FAM171B-like [Rhinatrema bivittatum]XP_029450976.1 protein FAM171B-like [Rhinatrema bivittatum]XP_029450977.1 protein FAM171B-like [Rhinatrema bivittatum]
MDSRHHAMFLLVILVGTVLLLLAASVLFICYCRKKCLKTKKSQRVSLNLNALTKNQATSMTGVSLILSAPPSLTFKGHQTFKYSPSPVKEDLVHGEEGYVILCPSSENQIAQKSATSCPGQQSWHNAEKIPINLLEQGDQTSVLQYMSSPSVSLMESILGPGRDVEFGPFCVKDRMCSSSMKSSADVNFVFVPMESPIPNASLIGHSSTSSLPRDLEDCLAGSESLDDQQYSWSSATLINTLIQNSVQGQPNGLMAMNHDGEHVESLSMPSTLKRPSFATVNLEGKTAGKSLTQLPKSAGLLQPMAWFISLANGPFSDGAPVGKKDLNNITSLDSGVDVIELQVRQDSEEVVKKGVDPGEFIRGLRSQEDPSGSEWDASRLVIEEGNGNIRLMGGLGRDQSGTELQIAHKEAAMKLNEAHRRSKRSLWQKREERPLMGIN